ncbi:MAG TPA: DUF488 family protein [Micromonosporaceae bacterium]|jgi:uncharacterized protein YeaO (DUF488 family)
MVRVARVYEPPSADDGARVLVDRLWPRGLRKDAAHLDDWCKEVAPSNELRAWYGHDPERFKEFERRYKQELHDPERREALSRLKTRAKSEPMTLLTATHDFEISHAAVLAKMLGR